MKTSNLTIEQARFIWRMEVELPTNEYKGTTEQINKAQQILDSRNQLFSQYKIQKDDFWEDTWETVKVN